MILGPENIQKWCHEFKFVIMIIIYYGIDTIFIDTSFFSFNCFSKIQKQIGHHVAIHQKVTLLLQKEQTSFLTYQKVE